jgi:hypothetical protein
MTRESLAGDPNNAHAGGPQLHRNLILGSLQLISWLLLHPSAWRDHVARIDPNLGPLFCLAELNHAQWRSPVLRRLVLRGCLVLPILAGLLAGVVLWILGRPGQYILVGAVRGAADGVTAGLALAVALSVSAGVAGGAAAGLAIGVQVGVTGRSPGGVALAVPLGVALAVLFNLASRGSAYSAGRQIGSVVIGAVVGSLALLGAYAAAAAVTYVVAGEVPFAAHGFYPYDIVGGVGIGVAIGLHTGSWRRGLAFGVAGSAAVYAAFAVVGQGGSSVAGGVVPALAYGVADGLMFSAFAAPPWVVARRIAGPRAGAIAGVLACGAWAALMVLGDVPLWLNLSLLLLAVLLGSTLSRWCPVLLYPLTSAWNTLLYHADERRAPGRSTLLRYHSAFWNEHQRLPLSGLEDHLVLVTERNREEGQAAMQYLAAGHQRWAVQAAQIELDARSLEACEDIAQARRAYHRLGASELEGPANALLRSFSRISQDVDAALNQDSAYNQRLALTAVEDRLDALLRELARSSESYAARFRPVATRWRRVVGGYACELAREAEMRQEIDNPYVIGVPLTQQQEIFVGRTDAIGRIEELLLDRRRPPLLLYGQRRVGKTSLLNNLGRLLPSTITPLFVDLQGPATQASGHAGFLYNIARGMVDSARRQRGLTLPPLSREALAADPFTSFDEWLDRVEEVLGQDSALLALDEFESLENAIGRARLEEEAVLGMLRHLIQHRPRFKVLLATSHTLGELQRWASYLINVQVVHIGYLTEAEARQVIERPVKGFALRYEAEAVRLVLDLTRGHPFLVQLLCAEIVALKNQQSPAVRRLACPDDVRAAVPDALANGSFFFADIERNQVDEEGLALLRFVAAQGEGAVVGPELLDPRFADGLEEALVLPCRRELIEPVDGGYRFQVELIRRWFARSP